MLQIVTVVSCRGHPTDVILILEEFTIKDKLECFRASDPKCLY